MAITWCEVSMLKSFIAKQRDVLAGLRPYSSFVSVGGGGSTLCRMVLQLKFILSPQWEVFKRIKVRKGTKIGQIAKQNKREKEEECKELKKIESGIHRQMK